MGYYWYGHHHLDFVFREYLGEIATELGQGSKLQAREQTDAEISEIGKWAARLAGFIVVEALALWGWRRLFRRRVAPAIAGWQALHPRRSAAGLAAGLLAGAIGCGAHTPYAVRSVPIHSASHYSLAQNPVLFGWETLHVALERPIPPVLPLAVESLAFEQTLPELHAAMGTGASFPFSDYPLIRLSARGSDDQPARSVNVLLLFIEGLDRRYLQQTIRGTRVTPFPDRFRAESLYFAHSFSNGAQTC
jgi:hypothetical protein